MAPKKKAAAASDEQPAVTKKLKSNGDSKDSKTGAADFLSDVATQHSTHNKCCGGAAIDSADCKLEYMGGWGGEHSSQCLPGVLLPGQVTPQKYAPLHTLIPTPTQPNS